MYAHRIVRTLQGSYFVYCAQAWQQAAAMITRRIPITCPPVTAEDFDPAWMEGKRLLIFKLHGYPDDPNWYGLDRDREKPIALRPDLVTGANLTGAIVLAIVCHGADSALQDAFFAAGASAFIGSSKEVRARERRPGEADSLVRILLTTLAKAPHDVPGAFAKARMLYREAATNWSEHDEYTLQAFKLITPKGGHHA